MPYFIIKPDIQPGEVRITGTNCICASQMRKQESEIARCSHSVDDEAGTRAVFDLRTLSL